ncbi:MAG: hypothetical protein KDE59_02095 [Anaerolineales bacterium]|nr:hypothetical protein [Anaerolineales bacterium]
METLTILGLLLAAILVFLFIAYWRSAPAQPVTRTSDEEFLVRIDQAQVQLEQEQQRRASAEKERDQLEAELKQLREHPLPSAGARQEQVQLQAENDKLRQQLATAQKRSADLAGQLARQTPAVAVAEGGNDADPTELIRLREQMADLESQLQDAQALAGQFPIQAVEIRRLEHQLTEMRAERDDLKAKVTEAAVYIRDVQKRYQLVLDKMRQLLVQRERGASPESLASLKAQVESEDLDSATGIAADDTKVAVSVSQLLPKDRPVDEDDLTPPLNKSGNGVHKTPTVVSILEVEPAEAADDEADDDIPKTEFMPLPAVEPISAKRSVDLQVIKGIGRTYAQRLREAGIHSLSELVKATPEQLREVTGIEEWHAADPASWIAQARQLLASG